jgi:hypothetical protein
MIPAGSFGREDLMRNAVRMAKAGGERSGTSSGAARTGRALVAGLAIAALSFAASPARASDYDPQKAGNPLKIVYYAVYPVAFAVDWLILRPAYFIGQYEPFHTIFGTTVHPELPEPPPPPPIPS